jgi:murein DD-endopeptidase MepM/ murein hydrolase activator NlpD
MLDPRLRLRVSAVADLPALFEQLFQTFVPRARASWREARAQLDREVWLPLERACLPVWVAAVAALQQQVGSVRREAAALSATALTLWREGLTHLQLEWHLFRRALRRLGMRLLTHAHPAWVAWRERWERVSARSAEAVQRATAISTNYLAHSSAVAEQAATQFARAAVERLPLELRQNLGRAWEASRPWQERFVRLSQQPAYVNAISILVVNAYLGLALASLAIVAFATPPLPPLAEPLPQLQANAYLGQRGLLGKDATRTPTPSPTPLPTSTAPPTATPEPVLTATPIPIVYTAWDSSLPQYGGWNGAGECWGPVLAPPGTGAFVWPTDRRYLVGKNFSWRWHPGLDLGGEFDEPIYAADSGVVVYAGWNSYGYGNLVILDHGNGWHSLYAHFNSVLVACGEGVTQGQIIGLSGSTGRSTGPHLHFEMRLDGTYVNPWDYLPAP